MGVVPDLKPLWKVMERMVDAFNRLAKAIEEQNEITREVNGLNIDTEGYHVKSKRAV